MTALAEKPTSTDLVVSNDFVEVERALAELSEACDIGTLHRAAQEAEAYRLYHIRARSKERANWFARIKVLAEAGIGWIDVSEYPTRLYPRAPLVIDGMTIVTTVRQRWRILGCANHRNLLGEWLDELVSDPAQDVCTTTRISDLCQTRGAYWVERERIMLALKDTRTTRDELARRLGYASGKSLTAHCEHKDKRMQYGVAWQIGKAMGLDVKRLPPVEASPARSAAAKRRHAARRALRDQERANAVQRHGGNIREAYSLLRKCAQVLDPAEHDFTTKEAKAHVRSAYAALRRAEDEIAQALGVA